MIVVIGKILVSGLPVATPADYIFKWFRERPEMGTGEPIKVEAKSVFRLSVKPVAKTIRVDFGGKTIAQSNRGLFDVNLSL
jgi:hypothetical protein|tara:strand:+ start:542 stop:784 length:243 start_codon:yes stop_codon:yes gene_type:complete